jgi:hypothetical protein
MIISSFLFFLPWPCVGQTSKRGPTEPFTYLCEPYAFPYPHISPSLSSSTRRGFPWTINNHCQCSYFQRGNEGLQPNRRLSRAQALSNRRRLPRLFASHHFFPVQILDPPDSEIHQLRQRINGLTTKSRFQCPDTFMVV